MERLKKVVLIETIVLVMLIAYIIFSMNHVGTGYVIDNKVSYCSQYQFEDKTCLISPQISTGVGQAQTRPILNFRPLQQDLQSYIDSNRINASLYVLNLRDGSSFGINGVQGFTPASLNKLPIAIVILKQVEAGELSLDDYLDIKDYHRDDSSGSLYNNPTKKMKVRDLLYYMLSESDNTALRVFEERVTLVDLQNTSSYLGYYLKDINLTGQNNTYLVSPRTTSNLFISLYLSADLKPEHSQLILSLLTDTAFDIKKYANLPEEVKVAQKYAVYYADGNEYFHDCGIMYIDDNRMLYCIMTKGLDQDEGSQVVGNMVNKIYKYTLEQDAKY